MEIAIFMASTAGRLLRVVVGMVLILVGLIAIGGTLGYVVALIGVVPILAGALDVCLIAPLFGMSIRGREIRRV